MQDVLGRHFLNYFTKILLIFLITTSGNTFAEQSIEIKNIFLNKTDLQTYEKLELTLDISGLEYNNPFAPEQIDITTTFVSPSGKKWFIWGFFDGSNWKVRFAANESGQWRYSVHVSNYGTSMTSDSGNFNVSTSSNPGWLKISKKNPHYFTYSNGAPFMGIGQAGGKSNGKSLASLQQIMQNMADYNLNTLVVWWGAHFPLESEGYNTQNSGLGYYDMEQAKIIDEIVASAELNHIKLIPMLWSHGQFHNKFNTTWNHPGRTKRRNPYRHINSGTLSPQQWSTDSSSLNFQKRLLRYIIARWSYSSSIGIWGVMSEINITPLDQKEQWTATINRWLHNNDPFHHPTTISLSNNKTDLSIYKNIDSIDYHAYEPKKANISRKALLIKSLNRIYGLNKPFFIGEFGTNKPQLRKDLFVQTTWLSILSGSAIAPLYWWMSNDRYSQPEGSFSWSNYLQLQNITAQIVKDFPFNSKNIKPAKINTDFSLQIKLDKSEIISKFDYFVPLAKNWEYSLANTKPKIGLKSPRIYPALIGYLHGNSHKKSTRSHSFVGYFSNNAKLTITLSGYSKSGAKLIVKANGGVLKTSQLKSKPIKQGSPYIVRDNRKISINIPAGFQHIKISNTGKDWILIDNYFFTNIMELKNSVNLNKFSKNNNSIKILRNNSNFLGFISQGFQFGDSLININNINSGLYSIQWFDPYTGKTISSIKQKLSNKESILIPKYDSALVFKITSPK